MDQDLYLPDVYHAPTLLQTPIDLSVNHNVPPLSTVDTFALIFVRLPLIEEGMRKKGKGEEEKEEEKGVEDEGWKEEEL